MVRGLTQLGIRESSIRRKLRNQAYVDYYACNIQLQTGQK
jgi:hypothetical protein